MRWGKSVARKGRIQKHLLSVEISINAEIQCKISKQHSKVRLLSDSRLFSGGTLQIWCNRFFEAKSKPQARILYQRT